MNNPVVVLGTARTPLGELQGDLSSLAAPQLGAAAIAAAVERSALGGRAVDEVIFGCVLSAGQGQAPARQAAIAAGLGVAAPATTISSGRTCRPSCAIITAIMPEPHILLTVVAGAATPRPAAIAA